jgi:hypothetical protein
MNNTKAEDVNTHAASPVSISTPPSRVGCLAGASFRDSVSAVFLLFEQVVNTTGVDTNDDLAVVARYPASQSQWLVET